MDAPKYLADWWRTLASCVHDVVELLDRLMPDLPLSLQLVENLLMWWTASAILVIPFVQAAAVAGLLPRESAVHGGNSDSFCHSCLPSQSPGIAKVSYLVPVYGVSCFTRVNVGLRPRRTWIRSTGLTGQCFGGYVMSD